MERQEKQRRRKKRPQSGERRADSKESRLGREAKGGHNLSTLASSHQLPPDGKGINSGGLPEAREERSKRGASRE